MRHGWAGPLERVVVLHWGSSGGGEDLKRGEGTIGSIMCAICHCEEGRKRSGVCEGG